MKSLNISSGRLVKTTAGWLHGVNSVRSPWNIPEDQVKWAVNCSFRGGIAQTRSGFAMRLSLPAGNFQGGTLFNANKQAKAASVETNATGVTISQQSTIYNYDGTEVIASELPYVVFAVDGKVYFYPFPLVQPQNWSEYQLPNISLDPNIDKVNFVIATQQASTSAGGNTTITPSHRILIVQDGINKAGYWDGSDSVGGQSNDMPIGYWMAYSGSRLWVATGNTIAASDLADPLGWSERKQGTGRGDFAVARPVTAMVDYVGQNNDTRLYVFTDRATYTLASGVLDRSQWVSTANFQQTVFPNIGCIAGKSIAFQAGQMWWYSQGGLVAIDVAASSYLSSQVIYKDVEMAKAKRLMAGDYTGICATSFENYLLYSIPYLEKLNSATMVLDYAAASELNQARIPAWCGVWNGIRPVEWSLNIIDSQPRCFAFSVDYNKTADGSYNHLWEAFTQDRHDTYLQINQDGTTQDIVSRIYCQLETGLLGDSMDFKQMAYGELDCSQIAGAVDVKVSYRGSKGTYQQILNTRLLAATDSYQYASSSFADDIAQLGFLQTQYRRLITENTSRSNSQTSCESSYTLDVDKAFSFLVEWCGAFGVDSIRMYQDPWSSPSVGMVTKPDSTYCAISEDGSSHTFDLQEPPLDTPQIGKQSYSSTQTRSATNSCTNGSASVTATATASYTSYISPADAVAQAAALATKEAQVSAQQYRNANPC